MPGGNPPGTVADAQAGQLFSMLSRVVFASCCPEIHETISRQKDPVPTSPGIWSEPSNRNEVEL